MKQSCILHQLPRPPGEQRKVLLRRAQRLPEPHRQADAPRGRHGRHRIVTQWTYDSHNRLLEMIYPDEEKVTYTYDLGGQLTNVHGYKSYGYDYVSRIGYDKFGQRTYMKYCNGADSKTASYTLAMSYDNMHRITSKSQHLTQGNLQFDGTLNVGYDLAYTYGQEDGKKFQLDNVRDVNYRTEATPDENQKTRNSHAYEYDANGNLVYVNTGRVKKDGGTDEKARERKLKWDEENLLLASDDDGFVMNYWYDADGERTVKTSGESDKLLPNGATLSDEDCFIYGGALTHRQVPHAGRHGTEIHYQLTAI